MGASARSTLGRRGAGLVSYLGLEALVPIALIAGFAAVGAGASLLAPYDPTEIDLSDAFAGASAVHLLGADHLGRDILSRLMWGSRSSLIGPLLVVLASGSAAVCIATVAVWNGGWVDRVVSRVLDVLFVFPGVLLALLIAAMFGGSFLTAVTALSLSAVPYKTRVIRGAALQERALPYIAALEVQGMSGVQICVRHLLPALVPLISTQLVISFGFATIELAAVSFLGLGVQAPNADWGLMISEGQEYLLGGYPQESLLAGALIVTSVAAMTVVGDRIGARSRLRSLR